MTCLRASWILALGCLLGCADTTRLTDHHYPPKPEGFPIEVFASQAPTKAYEEIAIVSENSEWTTDRGKLLESLKRQAREVGADAIILKHAGTSAAAGPTYASTNPTTGMTTYNSTTTVMGVAEGIAVRWK